MERISMLHMLTIAIPEFVLFVLIGNKILSGTYLSDRSQKYLKLAVSTIFFLTVNRLSRMYFHNFTHVLLATMACYFISFVAVYKYNFRKSVIAMSVISFLMVGAELFLAQIVVNYINSIGVELTLGTFRVLISIPTRMVQILILALLHFRKMTFAEHLLLNVRYSALESERRFIIVLINVMLLATTGVLAVFADMILRGPLYGMDLAPFNSNFFALFILDGIFAAVALLLLLKTMDHSSLVLTNKTQAELLDKYVLNSREEAN